MAPSSIINTAAVNHYTLYLYSDLFPSKFHSLFSSENDGTTTQWEHFDDTFSRFDTIPDHYRQITWTDRHLMAINNTTHISLFGICWMLMLMCSCRRSTKWRVVDAKPGTCFWFLKVKFLCIYPHVCICLERVDAFVWTSVTVCYLQIIHWICILAYFCAKCRML